VALKILKSCATNGTKRTDELNLCLRAVSADPKHSGYQHIVPLLDNFVQNGPNGEHLCLVMELLGESLGTMQRRLQGFRFPISIVKEIARQTLLGLDYLHTGCGIIHTGMSQRRNSC
jgi:serine/threonine-protein kinase SRPK3